MRLAAADGVAMSSKTAREPHPAHCHGCRHSCHYATIIHGQAHHHGLCLRPRGHTVWGGGCRHFSEAAAKHSNGICKEKG
jgi:hypothetical protein